MIIKLMFLFLLVFGCNTPSKKNSGVGDQCGGFAGLECKEGLICQPDDSMVVDGFGKCVEKKD